MMSTTTTERHEGIKDEIRSRLHQAGQRFTPEREALVETLYDSHRAVTPQELYEAARTRAQVGLTTAYRILETLTRIGYCQVILLDGELRYSLCRPTHHHHLVCTECKRVEEFAACSLEGAAVGGFKSTSHRVEIFGICEACQEARR
ncbi:MAG: Fur family transcriptional regulator [Actinomycetota bacterium]|nr:Fur family transcriptional regulator [Actinomycetota bacterium]